LSIVNDILKHNTKFVEEGGYKPFESDVFPNKKLAIVACMDSRLIELLPAALDLKNGDAKIIKTAGGFISNPYGSALRSLLVSIYALGVEEVMVIAHTRCGMDKLDTKKLVEKMADRGVSKDKLDSCKVDVHGWLKGFDDLDGSVKESVKIIKEHPLMPKSIQVHGFVIDIDTGKLTQVN
jgi:carbonic anhydrase